MLENTLFGYYITGVVPVDKNYMDIPVNPSISSTAERMLPVPLNSDESFTKEHDLKYELGIFWDKETLGIYSHELHHNDEAALRSFKDGVKNVQ